MQAIAIDHTELLMIQHVYLTLEKKWNFLLKHSTGNVQEISIDIYCSKTVVIPYLGNFKCQGYFLASTEILNFMHFFYIQNA